jgi:hypothetical protein
MRFFFHPSGETNKELQIPMSTENTADDNTSAKGLVKKSLSEGDEKEVDRATVCMSNILSIPKAKRTIKRERTERQKFI